MMKLMKKKKQLGIAVIALLAIVATIFTSASGVFATNKSASLMLCSASSKRCGVISEYNSGYSHGKVLYAMLNKKIAYCMNYGLSANEGQSMNSSDSSRTSLSADKRKQLLLTLHFGYYTTSMSAPETWQQNQYIATQAMVWNISKGLCGTSQGDSAAKKLCNTAPSPSSSFEYYKNLKNRVLASYNNKKPSFAAATKEKAKTYKLEWSEKNNRYETTIKDKNGMLSNYSVSLSGYNVSKNKNSITIYTKKANTTAKAGTLKADSDIVEVGTGATYWSCGSSGHQEFVSGQPSVSNVNYYFKVVTSTEGHGKLYKTDSEDGTPLKNAKYGLYSDSKCTKKIATLTTNSRGIAETSTLSAGNYYVKEIKAPEGYEVNPKVYTLTIKAGKTTTLRVEDDKLYADLTTLEVPKGNLTVEKTGERLSGWNNDNFSYNKEKLSNAVFLVTADEDIILEDGTVALHAGDKVGEITTGKNGSGVLTGLPYGTYCITETSAPDGFVLNTEKKKVTINGTEGKSKTVTFENKRQKVSLSIIKKDANDKSPVVGAEFELYADSDILNEDGKVIVSKGTLLESAVSNENGIVSFKKDYPLSKYVAKETKAPSGYLLNKETVSFDADYKGSDKEFVECNKEFLNTPVTVEISKMDVTNTVELEGAKLSVLDSQGNVVDSWESKKGESHSITKLTIGETYTLHEEIAPYGFLVAEDIQFTVEDTGKVQKVVMHDLVPTGTIKLTKKGEYLKGVKKDEKGQLTFEYSNEILSGVKFDVYAAEDIVSPDGQKKIYYKSGELVGSLTTDDKGTATMNNLPLGKYNIVEKSTLDDFILDSEPQLADLSYVDQNTKEVVADVEIINKRQKLEVTLCKKDADTGNVVSGAAFGVYATNDLLNYAGEVIVKADTLITTATSDNDGLAVFNELLPLGQYYVKEEKAPVGYVKEDRNISLSATYDKEKGEVQSFKTDVENHPTKVDFYKTDITGEQEIVGAKLSLLNSNGEVIDSWVSEEKPHRIEKLPVGKYILREELAPYGYIVANDVEFEVSETAEIQQCLMKDDYAKGKLQIVKTDEETSDVLEGAKFEILDENDNVIETITTNEEGVAESQLLPIAEFKDGSYVQDIKYKIVEVEAPEGYELDDTVNEMSFAYTDDKTPVIVQSYGVTNKRTEVSVEMPDVPNADTEETTPTDNTDFSWSGPQTGDNTVIWRYVALIVISIVGMTICVVSMHKQKKKESPVDNKNIFKS